MVANVLEISGRMLSLTPSPKNHTFKSLLIDERSMTYSYSVIAKFGHEEINKSSRCSVFKFKDI